MSTEIKISQVSFIIRKCLYPTGKSRNKRLIQYLATWNLELRSPDRITEALKLTEKDLVLLNDLGYLPDGWHPFEFTPEDVCQTELLVTLGLIRLTWRGYKVSLTDAGRFLLALTSIDPQTKKRQLCTSSSLPGSSVLSF